MEKDKVDRNLMQDVIDSMIAHGDAYKDKLRELNKQFEVPYNIKDHVIRVYAPNKSNNVLNKQI